MLTVAQNERLTQVGPGTPMGALFRRYWLPIAAAGKLDEEPTLEVRILGEDLVLYKDRSGQLGLIDRYCAHRRVNLAYGIPEENGLRCMYHGWLYDETGQCAEQPFEETVRPEARFKDKIKLKGYPVQAFQGLIWAYMGPLPAPVLPGWEPMVRENTVKDIAITELPCSWLQCMENSMDPVHVEWLHVELPRFLRETRGDFGGLLPPRMRHEKIAFTPFEHGIIKRRVLEGRRRRTTTGRWATLYCSPISCTPVPSWRRPFNIASPSTTSTRCTSPTTRTTPTLAGTRRNRTASRSVT